MSKPTVFVDPSDLPSDRRPKNHVCPTCGNADIEQTGVFWMIGVVSYDCPACGLKEFGLRFDSPLKPLAEGESDGRHVQPGDV